MVQQSKFQNLIEELKRRRVFRVATLYVVAMWPIIQIADILSPALNLPDGAMRTLLLVFISGFPIAIGLAWLFNLTPKGVVKVQALDENGSPVAEQRLIGKNVELLIVSVLLLLAISLFIFQGDITSSSDDSLTESANLSTAVEVNKINSIAVLPFVPFSENKQDEYFADGLSEELLNVLAKIKSLRVVARTSSFAYKGVSRNVQEVGKELGVDVILEGSVRRNDVNNTIRVTAQLIDVKTGTHLWSETYDRQFKDIFKIQDEITAAVVDELKITLLGEEQQQLLAHESANPEAMVAHSMGRSELAKRTGTAILQAEKYFLKAVQDDPGYATAYASLSEAYSLSIGYAGMPKDEYHAKAQTAVDRALELDPELGLAWAAQGLIYYSSMDMKKDAIEALEKAIELNPSYAMAYMWYGSLQDDINIRTEYYQKAFKLDPKSAVAGYNVANNLIELGRDSEAMEVFGQIVDADPFYPGAYILVAQINEYSGRIDQAIIQYKKAYSLGEERKLAINIASLYIDLGDYENSNNWIKVATNASGEDYYGQLDWLNVANLLAEGKRKDAEEIMVGFKTVDEPNLKDYYRAVIANYILKDYPEVIRQFELAEGMTDELDVEPLSHGGVDAYIYASYAYQQLENFEKSKALIREINAEQDRIATSGGRVPSSLWYQKSLIQSIAGEKKMSLINLQRAIDEGWSQSFRITEEPIFEPLKSDENFKAMLAGLKTRMSLLREQLAFEESFADHWKG